MVESAKAVSEHQRILLRIDTGFDGGTSNRLVAVEPQYRDRAEALEAAGLRE